MMRTPNRDIAKERAATAGLVYALGVTDGLFYVGTFEELRKLPCVIQESFEVPKDAKATPPGA